MKNILLYLLLCFTTGLYSQQVQDTLILYPTYDDFQEEKGILKVGRYRYHSSTSSFGNDYFTLKNKDKSVAWRKRKVNISGKKYWGFHLNGVLFRMYGGNPLCVLNQEKVIYYEAGIRHLTSLIWKRKRTAFSGVRTCFISDNINSKILWIPGFGMIGNGKFHDKAVKEFPQHEELFTCIGRGLHKLQHIRKCIEHYSGKELLDWEVK